MIKELFNKATKAIIISTLALATLTAPHKTEEIYAETTKIETTINPNDTANQDLKIVDNGNPYITVSDEELYNVIYNEEIVTEMPNPMLYKDWLKPVTAEALEQYYNYSNKIFLRDLTENEDWFDNTLEEHFYDTVTFYYDKTSDKYIRLYSIDDLPEITNKLDLPDDINEGTTRLDQEGREYARKGYILEVNNGLRTLYNPSDFKINKENVTLQVGETTNIYIATINGEQSYLCDYTSKKGIVKQNGYLTTAKKVGTTKLAPNFLKDFNQFYCTITVVPQKIGIYTTDKKLSNKEVSKIKDKQFKLETSVAINKGETVYALARKLDNVDGTVTFKSADKKIATVNKNGKIVGKSYGVTYITATVKDSDGNSYKSNLVVTVHDKSKLKDKVVYYYKAKALDQTKTIKSTYNYYMQLLADTINVEREIVGSPKATITATLISDSKISNYDLHTIYNKEENYYKGLFPKNSDINKSRILSSGISYINVAKDSENKSKLNITYTSSLALTVDMHAIEELLYTRWEGQVAGLFDSVMKSVPQIYDGDLSWTALYNKYYDTLDPFVTGNTDGIDKVYDWDSATYVKEHLFMVDEKHPSYDYLKETLNLYEFEREVKEEYYYDVATDYGYISLYLSDEEYNSLIVDGTLIKLSEPVLRYDDVFEEYIEYYHKLNL